MRILLIVVIFAVAVFLFGKLMIAYATKLTTVFVDNHHRDADEILSTGYMPYSWLVNTRGRTPRLRRRPTRDQALRRLRMTVRYFSRTPMVESEEARAAIISRLESVYRRWSSARLEDLVPPNLQ